MIDQEKSGRPFWSYVILAVKGVCMGVANWIPGVSGGTIAFVTGIYQELISSIKAVDLSLFKMLLQGNVRSVWRKVNGSFLVAVFSGVLLSLFSLANLMKYLLATHPIPMWSFFSGLVAASAIYVLTSLKGIKFGSWLVLVLGFVIAVVVCKISPTETPNGFWFIFLSGAVSVCAMILPGLSGSFVMILLGKYFFMMEAVTHLYWDIILVFAVGAAIGLVSFSHVLSWLLKKYYNPTVCLLVGFMFGSIEKIRPWREATFEPTQWGICVLFIALGFALVFGVEFLAKKTKAPF